MSKKSSVLLIVAAFVAVSGAAMAHVSLRIGVVRMGYHIGELSRERRALEEQRRRFTTEQSMLKNPARIERLAPAARGRKQRQRQRADESTPGEAQVVQPFVKAQRLHGPPQPGAHTSTSRRPSGFRRRAWSEPVRAAHRELQMWDA